MTQNNSQQYRLIDAEGVELAHADTIAYFKGVAADLKPGRYTIQEVVADSLGHAHEVRNWGSVTHLADGAIVLHEDDPTT
ncbi:MAG: hypothetical protein BGO49_15415 [Planctomycetales bacterium 71-10]|nr:MAG: hypothetical protein BGO49_15415 [Planctomycetales bacterium 71-10]